MPWPLSRLLPGTNRSSLSSVRTRLRLESLDERALPDATPAGQLPVGPISGSQVGSPGANLTQSAYAQYLATANEAHAGYTAAEAAARATYDAAGTAADAALAGALSGALADATTAGDTLVAGANVTMGQAWQTFTAAVDAAYTTFSAAWDAAGNDAARQQATATFVAAAGAADGQLKATFDAAAAALQPGLASVQAALDGATAAADQAWHTATSAALLAYNSTAQAAYATYAAAEQAAWNAYLSATSGSPLTPLVVANQQLTAQELDGQPGQPLPQPAPQPRQQMPPAPPAPPKALGDLIAPDLFKFKPKEDGTGFTIFGPKLSLGTVPLPFMPSDRWPKLNVIPEFGFNAYPKDNQAPVSAGAGFQLVFPVGPKPRR